MLRYQKVWYVIKDEQWFIKNQSLGVGMSIMPTVALIRGHLGMKDWPISIDQVECDNNDMFDRKYVLLDRKNKKIISEEDLTNHDDIYER